MSARGGGMGRARAMRWAGPVVAAVLAAILFARAADAFPYQFGVDFYQVWGVRTGHELLGASPYVDAVGYARALDGIADASGSQMLRNANRLYRDTLVPMATPFFNAVFALGPASYERARLAHAILLFAAAGAGVFLLARLRGASRWLALWLALAVELTFNPFLQDVRVGNVNSLQFLFVAAMLYVAVTGRNATSARSVFAYGAALAAFVLFKPNTLWIAAGLGIQCALAAGRRRFAVLVAGGVAGAVVAFAASAAYFNDAGVWRAWFECAQGMNHGVLSPSFIPGNQSLALALSRHSQAFGPAGYSMVLAAALGLGFLLALSSGGRGTAKMGSDAAACFSDAWFAASAGVVLTFAASPMVWPHYHVFALVPIAWLLRSDRAGSVETWSAVLCYAALSAPVIALLVGVEWFGLLDLLTLLSWTLLLPGLAARIATLRSGTEVPA